MYLEVGERLRLRPTAGGLVQQVAEHVEEEKYRQQVQKGEESLKQIKEYSK
jgi:hypothetical protein